MRRKNQMTASTLSTKEKQQQLNAISGEILQAMNYLDTHIKHSSPKKYYWKKRLQVLIERQNALLDDGDKNNNNVQPTSTQQENKKPRIDNSNFAKATAQHFYNRQDNVHNPILHRLLNTRYCTENVINDRYEKSYNAIRNNISAPLHYIRNQSQLTKVDEAASCAGRKEKKKFPALMTDSKKILNLIFIRDFFNIRSRGNIVVKDWIIEDKVMRSEFKNDFDDIVAEVRKYITKGHLNGFEGVAHRDAIQLIPDLNRTGSDQMAGSMMSNTKITGNIIKSTGELNGIFASDGVFKNLEISNNHIQTQGEHKININGMLSGKIVANTDLDNNALPAKNIKLLPLRIGGGANIYVIGFKNKPNTPQENMHHYEKIEGVAINDGSDPKKLYGDMRTLIEGSYAARTPGASFYDKVDMEEFHKEYAKKKDRILKGRKAADYRSIMAILVKKGYAVKVK